MLNKSRSDTENKTGHIGFVRHIVLFKIFAFKPALGRLRQEDPGQTEQA
jgi:hypothetical protein